MVKFFILVSLMCASVYAQSLKSFLELTTDEEKIQFLDEKTNLVDSEAALARYSARKPLVMEKLNKIGLSEIDVWYDTILEGPYSLIGEPKIELAGLYTKNKTVFAVSGVIYHPAVFTDDDACVYDEEKEEFTECPELTIYQHFIMDINGNYIESENYPETDY
jgi:hypothetical protein